MKILVTGGAGYIGSHTIVELLAVGHEVIVVDNLSNSSAEAVRRVEQISDKKVPLHIFDIRDKAKLTQLFAGEAFDAVMHFAGLKAVGESVEKPLEYYDNNVGGSIALLEVMTERDVHKLVFSSSATVYGTPQHLPLTEKSPTGHDITNPYGQTKYMIEQIMYDYTRANAAFEMSILRYFNPIGAHASGIIGEDPSDIPNNIMPYIAQVAVGRLPRVNVFGDDYDTPDGTGVRDYIHVVDLAKGHLAALEHSKPGVNTYNLGTGRGVSVRELIQAFSRVAGKDIPYEVTVRRPGDIASFYADATKAYRELGWQTEKTLDEACLDTWRWQSGNPDGYNAS